MEAFFGMAAMWSSKVSPTIDRLFLMESPMEDRRFKAAKICKK